MTAGGVRPVSNLRVVGKPSAPAPLRPAPGIALYDDFLPPDEQQAVMEFLRAPGWAFGAYSDPSPDASRYWYKHFCGYVKTGQEAHDLGALETELAGTAPLLAEMWRRIATDILPGHALTRCYANGYPHGSEGGLHLDSNVATHFTVIYYPHLSWHPNFAGETVFFDPTGNDIIAAVYPKPNRLVVFPGVIPHVARGVSRKCTDLRVTLMFKTAPR
jgi:SM-20-related protein